MLSVPLRLYSSACHSLMSSFTSVRGLLGEPSSSDFPIFPPPVPRDIALKPAQGKLSPLCARGRGAKSRADLAHLSQDFLRVLGIFELARKASDFHERAVQLLIEELDAAALVRALGLKQRIFARPLGGRPLGHLSSRKAGVVPPTRRAFPEAMPARIGRPPRKSS